MKKRILILGGGFGGVYTAVYLEKLMTPEERETTEIVIVSRDNYIVFQPLLPEVVSGSVELNHVISPIRRLARTARLYSREVEAIDIATRTVKLSPGAKPTPSMITYDHLVIALGTRLDHGKIPGMREHASPFKYLGDALYLRNQLVRALEEAEVETDPALRRALLTFVVAGGGFSGVECIAEMNDFLREAVRSYHQISEKDLRVVLLQRGDRILPEVTEGLGAFAHQLLVKRGIEIQLGSGLKAVSADAVLIEDSKTKQTQVIATRTTVATVPAGPHPLLGTLPLPQEKGRIKVDEGMEVPRRPRRLGPGRLRAGQTGRRKFFASDGTARPETGEDLRAQHPRLHARRQKRGLFLHRPGKNGIARPPVRGCGNLWHPVDGTSRVDALAWCLRDQISRVRRSVAAHR